jgi:S-adenosylmethionine:diacylglycerol 3-amino-3-carboxypropyl transferase
VFCIAGAGSTARALAASGHEVTAVDINPEQIVYAEARAAGGPPCEGAAERLLSRGRGLLALAGWTEPKRREFLYLDDPAAQMEYWRKTLDSGLFRAGVDTLLSHWLLRLVYASPFVASLPKGFGAIVRARLARGWATHPNRTNRFAWHLLLGEELSGEEQTEPAPANSSIHFACADAAAFLESCPPASFDAFSVSNILDGAPASYTERLHAAVRRAAAPGAVVVTRSFAEPAAADECNQASRDRSLLWGVVDVR